MSSADKLLKTIKQWGKKNDEIRAMILVGSYAQKGKPDILSDLDVEIFTINPEAFTHHQDWLTTFASPWLVLEDQENISQALTVIYDPGIMVEFTFHPLAFCQTLTEKLPPHYQPGFKVLVDKDKRCRRLRRPEGSFPTPSQPDLAHFRAFCSAFWLHTFNTAKYLWRGELWRAKHHDWQTKQDLLTLMSWHAVLCQGKANFVTYEGRGLQTWIDPKTYTDLMTIFGRFYPADSWRALEDTQKLFARLAQEVASALKITYPQAQAEKMAGLIEKIKNTPPD